MNRMPDKVMIRLIDKTPDREMVTDPEQDTNQTEGTLSLQDLLNAQSVGDSTGTAPVATNPDEKQQADEAKPKKDGDG